MATLPLGWDVASIFGAEGDRPPCERLLKGVA
jgi:hypothetical protein